jgi:hypothetical protein
MARIGGILSYIRIALPDSHGLFIDWKAAKAAVETIRLLKPKQVIWLGDHSDVSGIHSVHPPNFIKELGYSLEADFDATYKFSLMVEEAAGDADHFVMAGNHEDHIERFISRSFRNERDAEKHYNLVAPEVRLKYKKRGFKYFRTSEFYMGLSVPGTIKLGKCFFTHGTHIGAHATAAHLSSFNANVVHGHTHRAQSVIRRTVADSEIGAWCPGTLATKQPLYHHNRVNEWSHGIGVQAVSRSGNFMHMNAPIINGKCMLAEFFKAA